MQLMPATAASLGVDPRDPTASVLGAAQLLRQNLDRFGNVPDALRAYNAGPDQRRWNNPETQAYVGRVASFYQKPQAGGTAAAPPPNQVASADTGSMTDADPSPIAQAAAPAFDPAAFAAKWGVGQPAAAVSPDQAAGFAAKWGINPSTSADQPVLATAGDPSQPDAQPGWLGQLAAGVDRGIHDVTDAPAELLARGSDAIGLTPLLQRAVGTGAAPDAASLQSSDQAGLSSFNENYGSSIPAAIGRIGANAVMTAPVARLASAAVGAAGAAAGVGAATSPFVNALSRGALAIGQGAAAGGAVGGLTAAGSGQDVGQGALQGAAFGGALAPIGAGLSAAGRSILGGAVSPERAALAQTARDTYGIPLTAPQISSSSGMKYAAGAAEVMGGHTGPSTADQMGAFTKAVSNTFGEDAPALTRQVMSQAQTRLGAEFDRIAGATTINADNQFISDIHQVAQDAGQVLTPQEVTPLQNQIDNITGAVQPNGTISGDAYQALTRKGAPLDRAMASDNPNVSYYAGQIRDTLDDAMTRSLTANGQSDLLADLQNARFQYKNLKTIEPLVNKSPDNQVSPLLLQGRVNSQFQGRAMQGAGPLGDLADIGQAFFRDAPNSGTAQRSLMIGRVGEIGGALATGFVNPAHGLMLGGGVAGQMLGGRALGGYLNSPGVAGSLINRSLYGGALNPAMSAPVAAAYGAGIPIANRLMAGQPQ